MEITDDITSTVINDLPEEILEYILLQLSPYKDLRSAKLVCKKWHRLVLGVVRQLCQAFHSSLWDGKLDWSVITPEAGSSITERYSHCACYFDKSVYIFGGCTSTNTTFNDLWRFDLRARQWIRPLAIGTYPSPKACASMVVYKDSLVLFGGWSHPTPYPLHQAARYFSELHIYKPESNRWFHMNTMSPVSPNPTAGHSASVVGDHMVVFGGSNVPWDRCNEERLGKKSTSRASVSTETSGVYTVVPRTPHPNPTAGHCASVVGDHMVVFGGSNVTWDRTNDVWVFDFIEMMWQRKQTSLKKPNPRYGQTQITLDRHHILVIGGCGGPNQIFNDLWLLKMDTDPWMWEEVTVENPQFSPPQLWCHPACKVDDKVVLLSKPIKPPPSKETSEQPHITRQKIWIPPREVHSQRSSSPQPGPSNADSPQGTPQQPVSESRDSSMDSDENTAASAQASGSSEFKHPGDVRSSPRSRGQGQMSHDRLQAYSYDTSFGGPSQHSRLQAFAVSNSDLGQPRPFMRPNASRNREKQLEALKKFEEKLQETLANQSRGQLSSNQSDTKSRYYKSPKPKTKEPVAPMLLHVLDIAEVTTSGVARWRPVVENESLNAAEETVFYSLVQGRGELILFGGVQKDIQSMQRGMDPKSHVVSNNLYILSPKKHSV